MAGTEAADVVLASASPRRRELLKHIFPEFRVIPSTVDESSIGEADPVRFAMAAAEAKARDVAEAHPGALVIGADTIVCLDREIFGKPVDRPHAEDMLKRLSGRRHRVITGVALFRKDDDNLVVSYEITYVVFRPLTEADISSYLDGQSFGDKAGSYAVQEIGDAFVEKIEGDYDNIVGFPVGRVRRMLKEFAAPVADLEVAGIDFPGPWAFADADGAKVLVPGAVPGDRVKGRLVWRKPRAAKIIRIESPSPDRVEAPCPHFGACGGCAFQNFRYARQLEIKRAYFEKTLRAGDAVGLNSAVWEPILPSPDLFGYRNKMEFAFGGTAGAITLGLRGRSLPFFRLHKRTVALDRCLIFGEAAERIFPAAREFADATGLQPYDPLSQKGFFRNLVLREAKSTGEILAVLVTRSGGIDAGRWAAQLMGRVPQVKSAWHAENDRVADMVDFQDARHAGGSAFIEEELNGLRFRIDPSSFLQPNPGAAALFYERVASAARESGIKRALGLFCGQGTIELALARSVREVIGIDSDPRNIRSAQANARLNGIENVKFIEGLVEKAVDGRALGDFDLVVLDPPRIGLHPEALTRVLGLRIPRLIYMSCNPASLARDLGFLGAGGYRLERVVCADFFPHTPHMEGLAFLRR